MKLIIAGSRHIDHLSRYWFRDTLSNFNIDCTLSADPIEIDEIVSGGASGVDTCGEKFAKSYHIPVKQFLPDWSLYGKYAGPKRNKEMAIYADALLLIWNGKSLGSKNMKNEMQKLGKPIFEVIIDH